MERNEQIFFQKNPPVYMRNEMRLRAIGWWILQDGLVWFGLVFLLHSHVFSGRACMGSMRQTRL
jgi:hypothetical protein